MDRHSTFGDKLARHGGKVSSAIDMVADNGIQLLLQNTVGQFCKWFRHRARGSLIRFGARENAAHVTFDFNYTQFLIGLPSAGFGQNKQIALAFPHTLNKRLLFAGEFYGQTQPDNATPAFASSLWALTYAVSPGLVFDGGFEAGLTSGGPHRDASAALYSIANLYPGWRRRVYQAKNGLVPSYEKTGNNPVNDKRTALVWHSYQQSLQIWLLPSVTCVKIIKLRKPLPPVSSDSIDGSGRANPRLSFVLVFVCGVWRCC